MTLFKIPAFLLAISIMAAPYVSLMSHAVVHRLFVFEQRHVHGNQAAGSHDQKQGQDHDHVVTIDMLSLAPVVSAVKLQPPLNHVFDDSTNFFKGSVLQSRQDLGVFKDVSPPFLIEPSIYFLLHPTNAPPLR